MQRFRKLCLAICLLLTSIATHAESRDTIQIIRINPQYSFPLSVKAGNYSGITYLGNNEYLVVDDKSASDGFHLFTIEIDSLTGNILYVSNHGFVSSGMANRDGEGIAYIKPINSVLISGELIIESWNIVWMEHLPDERPKYQKSSRILLQTWGLKPWDIPSLCIAYGPVMKAH